MKKKIFYLFCSSILYLTCFSISYAESVQKEHIEVELISDQLSIQSAATFTLAIRFQIEKGWHIYWKNPGDSGLPTKISWDLPAGYKAKPLQYPYPYKFVWGQYVGYGYHDEVVFLSEITAPDNVKPGDIADIKAKVEWLVCQDSCIRGKADLAMAIPVQSKAVIDNNQVKLFSKAGATLPIKLKDWNIKAFKNNTDLYLDISKPSWAKDDMNAIQFFCEESDIVDYKSEQILTKSNSGYLLQVKLIEADIDLKEIKGLLVSDIGWRGKQSEKALQVNSPVTPGIPTGSNAELDSLWLALVFAFVGGLILNLMPCVLPVLSLKVLGLIKHAGEDQSKLYLHGILFTVGVLASFLALATLIIVLKVSGEQLGWGFQLQSQSFVTVIGTFLFLFSLSLFGVFEMGFSLTTLGGSVHGSTNKSESFFTGVLATVVATPCTAPYMGSAMGYTLTQPIGVTFAIFAMIAIGMAMPYLLLTLFPIALKFVPKPGAWMESLKQFMGFLMLATVLWLVWVLGNQAVKEALNRKVETEQAMKAGVDAVVITLIVLLIVGIGAWVYGRWGTIVQSIKTRWVARAIALMLVLFGLFFGLSPSQGDEHKIQWQTFSQERVDELRKENRLIFIDFTADWCISCLANESVAFSSGDVIKKFHELNIVPLKADWTSYDKSITHALAKFGRNSVPLYIFYRGNADPVILPQVLTPDIVLDHIKQPTPQGE